MKGEEEVEKKEGPVANLRIDTRGYSGMREFLGYEFLADDRDAMFMARLLLNS